MSDVKVRKLVHGWNPDLPDQRDRLFKVPRAVKLPKSINLSKGFPEVFDQGELGSCTANAISSLISYSRKKAKLAVDIYSRLFIYYNERVIEHTVNQDSGAMIRDGIKTIANQGAAPESEWPYVISKYTQKPASKIYKDGLLNKISSYERVQQTENSLKQALAGGRPIVFGFSVYDSFESADVAKTGTVPMPKQDEKMLGGHAVVIVGYDDKKKRFIVRNSWGLDWGKKGYFTLPYAYVTNEDLAADFWTIACI